MPIQHAARQVTEEDYRQFTHILAADEANLRSLEQGKPRDATAEIKLWGSYVDLIGRHMASAAGKWKKCFLVRLQGQGGAVGHAKLS